MGTVKPYVQIENLTKSVGDKVLFQDISFGIAEGQHVGLIAKNGTGKSSLLNVIAGKDNGDSGNVIYRNGIKIGYLEQNPFYPKELTVIEACFWHGNSTTSLIKEYEKCLSTKGNPDLQSILDRMDQENAWDYETRAKQILGNLKIHDFNQPVSQLSGGQLKRVALANVLITEPDILILDEPTNHLDLAMIEWLENYLSRSYMTLLMVTHDRYFLDRVCDIILELDNKKIYTYRGNYAYYLEKRQERIDAERSEIARANNLYRTELEWMRRMPQARGHKARYREEAFYELEKIAKQRIEDEKIKLGNNSTYIGNKIFEADYISKSFKSSSENGNPLPDKVIVKDFYYNFSRYEKMGIVGPNGTGKSTFVKMLLGEIAPDKGRFVIGETVRFGYFSQDGIEFDESMKVVDAVRRIAEHIDLGNGKRLSATQFLQHFLFSPQAQQNYIYKLSGGEKRRLYLCTVLLQNPNFLVLDEPTNDLDIVTLQILEEYLKEFGGCVIVVSHDRYFMDKVVDHLLVFKGNGEIKDFPGNYTQFREWEKLESSDDVKIKENNKTEKTEKPRGNEKRKLSYKEKKELEHLNSEIEKLEQEKKQIETELCGGAISVEEITRMSKRLPELEKQLDEMSDRWLELSEYE